MYTKLISFVCLVLTFALASAAYAALPAVVGDWEGGPTDAYWTGGTPVTHIQTDPVWPPPPGTGSYQINNPPGWQTVVKFDAKSAGLSAEFGAATDLHIAVKMVASEWEEWFAAGGWVNAVDAVIMNSELGGWTQYDTPSWYPLDPPKPAPPPYYRDWQESSPGVHSDEVFLFDWTFGAIGGDPGGWAEIFIATNYDGAPEGTAHGNFYIDKVTLTPEPATIALLGLGSLALLRRRKR